MAGSLTKTQLRAALLGDNAQAWLRDSPIRHDVWLELLRAPHQAVSVLLIPITGVSPARVFKALQERNGNPIAFNQTVVVAELTLDQIVHAVLPLTAWWQDNADDFYLFLQGQSQEPDVSQHAMFARSMGLVVALQKTSQENRSQVVQTRFGDDFVEEAKSLDLAYEPATDVLVHAVARNRPARCSSTESVSTVKADAALRLFELDFSHITWAILDTGIDAGHRAFARSEQEGTTAADVVATSATKKSNKKATKKKSNKKATKKKSLEKATEKKDEPASPGRSRVALAYDFRRLPEIMRRASSADVADEEFLRTRYGLDADLLQDLKGSIQRGRDIDWSLLEEALLIADPAADPPAHPHGTHVAGILGGSDRALRSKQAPEDCAGVGMCPSISLVDLRVMQDDGTGDEFTVMAALQFVRFLNSRGERMVVHGVNVSVQIPHDVKDYACGRTPVCDECNRLVASGVCVVAAAGNFGVTREVALADASFVDYGESTITDPGNAQAVITVGATHRNRPHTFGVSYFSSRGPTGDGRLKPDLLAPGERIPGPTPGGGAAVMNGTSQAAPHVSGAAAILMARNRELIGQPARIKKILCDTATSLDREPYYQGSGLVDVLRALQAV